MAPVKISHVVSFSSQDPKYPVENLLNPDSQRGPWLSCPQDKSGQLKVELQLERAVPIGYIDVDDPGVDPSAPVSSVPSQGSNASESGPSPWMANPSIRRTFFPEPQMSTKEISDLKNVLQQLQPGTLGRSARMVLSAAHRAPPASGVSPKHSPAEPGPGHPDSAEPRPEEQNSENEVGKMKKQKVQARRPLSYSTSQPNRKERAKAGQREHHRPQAPTSRVQESGECPICSGSFSIETLPQHAATCGETSPPQPASPSWSPPVLWVSSESSSPVSWVQCPICQLHFSAGEIEEHASMCGEVPEA